MAKRPILTIFIIISFIVVGILFRDKINLGIGSDKYNPKVRFSVISYNGKVVSAVPIISETEEVIHFKDIPEDKLKKIIGIEKYFDLKSTIDSFKKPKRPSFITGKNGFEHNIISQEVSIETKNFKKKD